MNNTKPKFSFSTNLYLGVIASSIILFPVEFEAMRAKTATVTPHNWIMAASIVLITLVFMFHAGLRCTGEKLSYVQGLQFVTSFMRGAGLMYVTMILVFLSLIALIPASVVISIYGEITGKNNLTPMRYHKLVLLFHTHRARQ